MHKLDLNFHRHNAKKTVFEINKAVNSLQMGLFYIMADTSRHALETIFVSIMLWKIGGIK